MIINRCAGFIYRDFADVHDAHDLAEANATGYVCRYDSNRGKTHYPLSPSTHYFAEKSFMS